MREVEFGDAARTEVPEEWDVSVDDTGATVVWPADQDIAFLWLSVISGAPSSDESPANADLAEILAAIPADRTEDVNGLTINYSVKQRSEDGTIFETHEFQVSPMEQPRDRTLFALLTLSVRLQDGAAEFISRVIEQAWGISRRVRFE